MLTDAERAAIDTEIADSLTRSAASIPALRAVQRYRGWISDDTLRDVADYLNMTPADLENIATFYSLVFRHPVGKKVLAVCDSFVCWSLGQESLLSYLETKLSIKAGETTPDGRFTLIRIACLGDCDHAPCMMVNEEQIGNLTPALLDQILAGTCPQEAPA